MKASIALIVVIIFLAFFAIKTIYNITILIKKNEPETKYGKNRIKKDESTICDDIVIEEEKYERVIKPRTYSRRKTIEVKDEKYLQAKKYSDKIKITSLVGWIIAIAFLIIYYIKNNKI